MEKLIKTLFIVGFIVQVVNCTIFPSLWQNAWYHLNALSFLLFLLGIYFTYAVKWPRLCNILLYAACHKMADELFFDATKIEMNEYISFTVVLTLLLSQNGNGKRKKIF